MRKVNLIWFLLILITGCSVIKQRSNAHYILSEDLKSDSLLESIRKYNLANRSFQIQKAEIEISSGNEKQKLIANIKFEFPDKYLISLKSRTGIEAARIFISRDTILINDRLNRKLYFGKPMNLKSRYGIPANIFPVILGDFIYENKSYSKELYCKNGKVDIDFIVEGIKCRYIVDCSKGKLIHTSLEDSLSDDYMKIEYENLINTNYGLTPARIRIDYKKSIIGINIGKIESPWNSNIEFIPGNRYELIELL